MFNAKKPKLEQFSLAFDQVVIFPVYNDKVVVTFFTFCKELDHLDEEEIDNYLYGEDNESTDSKATSYQFEVCDSLLNIGPCGQVYRILGYFFFFFINLCICYL